MPALLAAVVPVPVTIAYESVWLASTSLAVIVPVTGAANASVADVSTIVAGVDTSEMTGSSLTSVTVIVRTWSYDNLS